MCMSSKYARVQCCKRIEHGKIILKQQICKNARVAIHDLTYLKVKRFKITKVLDDFTHPRSQKVQLPKNTPWLGDLKVKSATRAHKDTASHTRLSQFWQEWQGDDRFPDDDRCQDSYGMTRVHVYAWTWFISYSNCVFQAQFDAISRAWVPAQSFSSLPKYFRHRFTCTS